MLICLKILVLLWLVNLAPPLLAHYLGTTWDAPVDRHHSWRDGRELFGPHKTLRGLGAGIAAGCLVGWLLGFYWWAALSAAASSMAGDLLSSFIKRRLQIPSGHNLAGLDQLFEGALPLLPLAAAYALGVWQIVGVLAVFCGGAYVGSRLLDELLRKRPSAAYRRPLNSRTRLREIRSCQITSQPFHYLLNFEDAIYYHVIMRGTFRALGVYHRGMRNALEIDVNRFTLNFPDLPAAFDGYTFLFLSDLHLDGLEGLTDRLRELLSALPVDLCVLGGDLRMETHGPYAKVLREMRRLVPSIRARDGIYSVLGNHDCLELVEPLQELGIRYLVNDARAVERTGQRLWLVGVDDPHYYQCHSVPEAFQGVPEREFRVFVAHSNEIYRQAAAYAPQLYLCGHTHAGQIQIPGIGPVFTHSKAPRRMSEGIWHYRGMTGYTSRGVGVSGAPVRFFCRGEVAVITLTRTPE